MPQLRCFVAVVDAGSFAEAGRRLGMSTSALSKTITRFEAAHGLRLLHRSTHALSLTEAGEQLIDAAREAVQYMGLLEASLDELVATGGAGRVRVSASVTFVRRRLVPLLPAFIQKHPDIHLDIRASNELVDLAEEGVDLALRGGLLAGVPGHVQQPWFKYPWVVCAAPDYLSRRGTPRRPEDLREHDLLGFRNQKTGAIRPWRFRHPDSPRGEERSLLHTPSRPLIAIDDGEAVWGAGLAGMGLTMAPLWLAADALIDGSMVEVLRDWRGTATQVSLLRRERKFAQRRVEAVIDFLKAHTPTFDPELYVPD